MENHETPIVSAISAKGGVTKTSFIELMASYLTNGFYQGKPKRVLLVDLDYQGNLTSLFDLTPEQIKQHGIINAFKHDAKNPKAPFNFKPMKINKYLSILPATPDLINTDKIMQNKPTLSRYVLYQYLMSIKASDNYDYILEDNHNSFGLNTVNSLITSDVSIMPVLPSRFSMDGIKLTLQNIQDLKDNLLNPITKQSFITSKVYMIGAIVDYNSKLSYEFKQAITSMPNFICYFHRRVLYEYATMHHNNLFKEAKRRPNDQNVINNEIKPNMAKIVKIINKTCNK